MNTIVFSGQSPSDISGWLDSHSSVESTFSFQKLANQLENFPQLSGFLPRVGSSLSVKYKVDPNGEAVDTEWMVLGYNKDIPRFVKYKDSDGNKVYMDVLSSFTVQNSGQNITGQRLISSDFSVANVYRSKDGTDSVGTVDSFSENMFTYGNNNTYSVPGEITLSGTTYTFCGYNVTLQSKYGLVVKLGNNLYTWPQFDSQNHTDWKTSEIRSWLNGNGDISNQTWQFESNGQGGQASGDEIVMLPDRLTDTDFTNNIIPTVTRTWTRLIRRDRTEDSNNCQHLADRFRLLGVGEVNCKGSNTTSDFPDGEYDTSRFIEVFAQSDIEVEENTRKRYLMNEDGTEGSACNWWLRSAKSGDIVGHVGCVKTGGLVSDGSAHNYYAVLPTCLIG